MSARTLTAALAVMLVSASAQAQVAQYVVTALPHPSAPSPYFTTGAVGLNNAGQAAVNLRTTAMGVPPVHAGRFTPGVGTIDLGSLATGGLSTAQAINATGQVVGFTENQGTFERAFLYTDGVGMVNLGVLPGDALSFAFGINNAGVVVGSWLLSPGFDRAFRYTTTGGMTGLGMPPGTTFSRATAINDAGEVVVLAGVIGSPSRTFRYTDAGGYQDIGTLGGMVTTGEAINASGEVIGASTNSVGQNRAFRHTVAGGMQDLGTLPGFTDSFAFGINGVGDIVGAVEVGTDLRAVLYRDGLGIVDLNTLIGSGSGWTLLEATAINDFGQIAGFGDFNGGRQAFLLTPIPEPSALHLVTACAAAGAAVRRQDRRGHRGAFQQ